MKTYPILALLVTAVSIKVTPLAAQTGNTSFGLNAGGSITTGDFNSFFGEGAGASYTTGFNSVFIGYQAGNLLNNDSDNTVIGANAASMTGTGVDNVIIGTRAGVSSTGTDNVFVGSEAGTANTSGVDNIFIGEQAGFSNLTGGDNVFVGEDAGYSNVAASDNTAIGNQALRQNVNGRFNTAVGNEAGFDIGTLARETAEGVSTRNTVVGNVSGIDIGSGVANTFMGDNAGGNTEYAHFNTFMGFQAGGDNNRTNSTANANRNTALGAYAGYTNRDGEDNVWIGALADSGRWTFDQAGELEYLRAGANSWNPKTSTTSTTQITSQNNAIYRTTVIGTNAAVLEDDGTALGFGAVADGLGSLAIGSTTEALFPGSIAIGFGATTKGADSVVIGGDATVSWAPNLDGVTSLGTESFRFTGVYSSSVTALADSGDAASVELFADGGSNNSDRWRITALNNGPLSIQSEASGSSIPMLSVENNGNVSIAGDLTLESDARRKIDVTPISQALALVEAVESYRYRWQPELGRGDALHIGFLAQEVGAVAPELVHQRADGTLAVNYQGFIPLLASALRDLHTDSETTSSAHQAQLALQKQQLAAQEAEIRHLTAELAEQRALLQQLVAGLAANSETGSDAKTVLELASR